MTKPETEKLPEPLPLPDRRATEAECTEDAAKQFYAEGWNACLAALRAQGGGATPDAAPDAVTDAMVEAGAEGIWNMAPRGVPWAEATNFHNELRQASRAALTAAIAHARSAGGEGRE